MQTNVTENLGDCSPDEAQRRVLGSSVVEDRLHLRIPSRVDWVEQVVMYLANKAQTLGACDADRHGKLVTSLTEAITNAIVHGNLEIPSALKEDPNGAFAQTLAERAADAAYAERTVDITMNYDGGVCTWCITDQGHGFDVEAVLRKLDEPPDPEADPMTLLCSGRGIMLMRAFLDEVVWSQGGRQVTLTMTRQNCAERRAAPRSQASEPVRAAPVGEDGAIDWQAAFDAVTTDLSRGGVGLLADHGGQARRLMLELVVDGRTLYVPAEVTNLRPIDDQMVQIGCRFAPPTPQGDVESTREALAQQTALDSVLAKLEAPSDVQDERRRHARMPYTRPIRLISAAGEQAAVARDLSKSGVAFVAEFDLPRGEAVTVILDGDTSEPIRLAGQVARCHRVAGRFHDIGVRFAN